MKKIYISVLVLSSLISFNCHSKNNYLGVNEPFESIENYDGFTEIGRKAGTINEIDTDVFVKGHNSLSRDYERNDKSYILTTLNSTSRILNSTVAPINKSVTGQDINEFYKFDSIGATYYDRPLTGDDIVRINKEYDLTHKEKPVKINFLSNAKSNPPINSKVVSKHSPTITNPLTTSFTEIVDKEDPNAVVNAKDMTRLTRDTRLNVACYNTESINFKYTQNQETMDNELGNKKLSKSKI